MALSKNLRLEVILAATDKLTGPLKKAMAGSKGLAAAVRASKEQLKGLNDLQGKLDNFGRLKKGQLELAAAMQKTQSETGALARQLEAARRAAKPLEDNLAAAKLRSDQLRTSQKSLTTQIRAQSEELRKVNREQDQRAGQLRVLLQAKKSGSLTALQERDLSRLLPLQRATHDRQLELTDSLKALRAEKREGSKDLFKLRGELQYFKAEAGAATGVVDKLEKEFETSRAAARKLKAEHGDQAKKLEVLRRSLGSAGISTRDMAKGQRELSGNIRKVSTAAEQQQAKLARLAEQQRRLHAAKGSYDKTLAVRDKVAGAGAASAAGAAAVGGALAVPILNYAAAEDAATQLKVAMMLKDGTVAPEFERMNRLAEQLGNRLPGTTAELQGMMTMLVRQGISFDSILGGLGEASAYLGVQLKLPYETAAEYAAKMQDATGALESEMMDVMDTIQRTHYVGVDTSNMVSGFSKLAPVLDMIKQKGAAGARTMAPLLAMADQANLVGESAGNAYRKVFQRSMDKKKVSDGNDLLEKRGIARLDFTNGKGEFGGVEQMFTQLQKLKKLNTQDRLAVIGDIWGDDAETLQALNIMIDKGMDGYREMAAKMEAQADLRKRVDVQLGTLSNLWDAASGTFTNAMVKFGEVISPELKAITEWLANVSEKLSTWASANPVLAAAIMKTIAVIGLLLAAFAGLSLGIAAILGPMAIAKLTLATIGIKGAAIATPLWTLARSVLPALAGAIRFVMLAIMANPVGAAIALLVGLMTWAAVAIWQNWDTLGPKFRQLWESIRTGISGLFGWLGSLPARFAAAGAEMMTGLVNGITSRLGWIRDSIMGVGDSVIGWFKQKLDIHSPSRVFAELGGFTMAGLAQGLDKGQAGPLGAVQSLAGKLTAIGAGVLVGGGLAQADAIRIDNRPPVAMAAPAASGGGTVVQQVFHIHAAPGMDERALAAMVRREVEAAARAQAVRGRSSLKDRE
ncbi:phage tail tape measure protein [Laribacter hongkongensis]|uniref:phage tail tape measure protein n=1 Tax=Laribacter hongkongensis TaxID=168471 RepID=UPI001EFE0817|nr:phage tail tape measure protein [Laribacter hongkongensis]MCG9045110.1 phage tail tape measure protein [Laribacter hongkongensis]